MLLIKNDAYSTLAVDLLATDTSISLVAGTGDRFPVVADPDFAYATLQNAQGRKERIKITARASGEDVMTIVRAQDDSAARFWAAGDLIECRASAAVLAPLQVFEGEKTASGILAKLGFSTLGAALAKITSAAAARTAIGAKNFGQLLMLTETVDEARQALDLFNVIYPIGTIYRNASNNANPADLFGFGTWVAFGQGRVEVGAGTTNTVTAGNFVIGTSYTIASVGTTNFTAIGASANSVGVVFTAIKTVTAGSFVIGTSYTIASVGTTDFTAIGATSNTVGVVFTATGVGLGTGTATANSGLTGSGTGTAKTTFVATTLGGSADAVVVSHNHSLIDPGHSHKFGQRNGVNGAGGGSYPWGVTESASPQFDTDIKTTGISIATTGVPGANANYQPYIVIFMWMRTD